MHIDLINLYITSISTSFSKNFLIIINYKIGPHKKKLLKYPSFIYLFFLSGITISTVTTATTTTATTTITRNHYLYFHYP